MCFQSFLLFIPFKAWFCPELHLWCDILDSKGWGLLNSIKDKCLKTSYGEIYWASSSCVNFYSLNDWAGKTRDQLNEESSARGVGAGGMAVCTPGALYLGELSRGSQSSAVSRQSQPAASHQSQPWLISRLRSPHYFLQAQSFWVWS